MVRLVALFAAFSEVVLVAGAPASHCYDGSFMCEPYCCPTGYKRGKHHDPKALNPNKFWYCHHPLRATQTDYTQGTNAILLKEKDPQCSALGTETAMLEPYHNKDTLDIIATLKTYSAVVSKLTVEQGTDWNQNYDEVAIGMSCTGPDGKQIRILTCDASVLKKNQSAVHPDSQAYPYCGLQRIEGCDINSNLTIYLSEIDAGEAAMNGHDLGKYSIPASVLRVLAVGGTMNVRVSPGTYSNWDAFWNVFWTFQGEVCVTDFIPFVGKAAKAAKLSAKTIKAIQKIEKGVDRLDKLKTFAAPVFDLKQCNTSGLDCNGYMPDYVDGKANDLAKKCEPVFDECVTDQYTKGLAKALNIEESGGVSKFAQEIWKKQCWGPPDDDKAGTFMMTIRFLPPSADSTVSDSPAYYDYKAQETTWLNCQKCPMDPMCTLDAEGYTKFKRSDKAGLQLWNTRKPYDKYDAFWASGTGSDQVRRFETYPKPDPTCWQFIKLLDKTVDEDDEEDYDGADRGIGQKDEKQKLNGSPQMAGALSMLSMASVLAMIF